MRIISIFLVVAALATTAQATSIRIDKPKEKAEIKEIVIRDLWNTSWKIKPSEVVSAKFEAFDSNTYGKDLRTYGASFNYIEIVTKLRLTIRRGTNECDAVVNVKKLTKQVGHDSRKEYLFSADEWPYCIK